MAEYTLGVDAIIHVASPLVNAATTDVILDVRSNQFLLLAEQLIKISYRPPLLVPLAYWTLLSPPA